MARTRKPPRAGRGTGVGCVFRRTDTKTGRRKPGWYCSLVYPKGGSKRQLYGGITKELAQGTLSRLVVARDEGLAWDEARAFAHKGTRPAGKRLTFKQACEGYISAAGRRLGVGTLRDYRLKLDCVQREAGFAGLPLDRINGGHVEAWLDAKQDKGMSPATRNRYHATLSGMFRWATQTRNPSTGKRLLALNPMRDVPRQSEKGRERDLFLTDEETQALLDAAPDDDFRDFLRVLAETGLRRGAALALQWRDVDLRERSIRVRAETTKTNSARTVEMAPQVHATLKRRHEEREDADGYARVFRLTVDTVRYRWQKTLERAEGLPEHVRQQVRLHDLRHRFASVLANSGVELHVIAELMGHSIQHTTRRYAHLRRDTKRRAIRAAFGG